MPARVLVLIVSLLSYANPCLKADVEIDGREFKDVGVNGPSGRQVPGRELYVPGKVWQVHIALSAKEYEVMQPRRDGRGFPGFGGPAKPAPSETPEGPAREVHRNNFGMDLPWATGSVTLGDAKFENIGIRYKGNGTMGDASRAVKKSFKIDLDREGGTGQFGGSKTINLHCGVADPSKCRETLGYGLYRAAGVPASRTALAEVRITVPGKFDKELLGVYTIVEQVDKPFLRTHFGSDKGLLMKPERLREFEDNGEDWDRYKKQYAPKRDATADESKRVIAFAKLVHKADDDHFRKEIRSYLDVDAYLRFLAATAFVANSDSFFVLGHNYYIYLHPKMGRFHFIPWDLDRAFANFPILGSNTQQMDLSFTHPYSGTHRLTERVLAMPGVGEKYRKLLEKLAGKCFEKERLTKETETVEAAVKDLLERDVKAAQARKESSGFGPPRMFGKPPELKTFMEKRTESLVAQLAGKSKGHIPTGGGGFGAFKVGDMMAGPFMEALNTDKDGKLSKAEWLAAAKRVYNACQKDEQKRVNEKAIADALNGMFPKPPEGQQGPGPRGFSLGNFMAGPIVRRADKDKDAKVTLDELMSAADKLFDKFDKGKAGKLDATAFAGLLNELFPPPNFGPPGRAPGDRRFGPPGALPGGPPGEPAGASGVSPKEPKREGK